MLQKINGANYRSADADIVSNNEKTEHEVKHEAWSCFYRNFLNDVNSFGHQKTFSQVDEYCH